MSAFGGKRILRGLVEMSAYDPKRTLGRCHYRMTLGLLGEFGASGPTCHLAGISIVVVNGKPDMAIVGRNVR